MPKIPAKNWSGTKIQEGSRGTSDAAVKHWDAVFGPHTCGACKHRVDSKCQTGRRELVGASDEACVSRFERRECP
jgi:hypothetical protein